MLLKLYTSHSDCTIPNQRLHGPLVPGLAHDHTYLDQVISGAGIPLAEHMVKSSRPTSTNKFGGVKVMEGRTARVKVQNQSLFRD